MHMSAARALARMDPTIVVPMLEASWASDDIYHRMRSAEALGECMHPLAEASMVRLLPHESDGAVVAVLSGKLCELCTTEGLEELRQAVIEERYDGSMSDVMEELVTLAKIVSFAPPELEEWKSRLADNDHHQGRRRAFLGRMGGASEAAHQILDFLGAASRNQNATSGDLEP